mmetsp:Transcript_5044/g.8403  ORF Transcript_5044/g.8403 Transcript_5044/m.8403 type:complete len:112 (+) Transcript_5044:115-450(+)
MMWSRPANTTRLLGVLLFPLIFDELNEVPMRSPDELTSTEFFLKIPSGRLVPETAEGERSVDEEQVEENPDVSEDNDDRYENVVVISDSVEWEEELLLSSSFGFTGIHLIW